MRTRPLQSSLVMAAMICVVAVMGTADVGTVSASARESSDLTAAVKDADSAHASLPANALTSPTSVHTSTTTSDRAISWWWATEWNEPANSTRVDALVDFVKAHPTIVTTLIMRCGLVTCCRKGCDDCPNNPWTPSCSVTRTNCTNNNGMGGTVVGGLSPACQRAIPIVTQLGVRVELWLGEDDSIDSARYLFAHADDTASTLLKFAADNPDIKGFNIDLETGYGTPQDALDFAAFLKTVTSQLMRGPHGPLRFSADVACGDAGTINSRPLATNCSLLGRAGVGRIMNMATYNADGLRSWLYALQNALTSPLATLGVGMGCWIDSRTNNTWSITPQSAVDRVCALMNASVTEIDMFDISPDKGFPEPFWIPQLEKYMAGGGCPFTPPPPIVCPQPSSAWHPGGPDGCCESSANRGPGDNCNVTCAKDECAAAKMHWLPENFSSHPYTCCMPSGW
eukprot:m.195216 g.195216  ORF g.195216 m.195216 type:complete len:454 (-) comp19427_c0_seq1:180-1541(-)